MPVIILDDLARRLSVPMVTLTRAKCTIESAASPSIESLLGDVFFLRRVSVARRSSQFYL